MSGRVAAIDAVASDPDVIYVGAATGGVWKSVDGGLTWSRSSTTSRSPRSARSRSTSRTPTSSGSARAKGTSATAPRSATASTARSTAGAPGRTSGLDGTERIHRILLHPRDPNTAWVAALGRGVGRERRARRLPDRRTAERAGRKSSTSTSAPAPPTSRSTRRTRTSSSRRCGTTGAGRGSSAPAAPGRASSSRTTAAASWKRLTEEDGLPKGSSDASASRSLRSDPSIVYALVEAEKSALLRSEDGGQELEDDERRERRRLRARSTTPTSASTRRTRTASTASRRSCGLRGRRQDASGR